MQSLISIFRVTINSGLFIKKKFTYFSRLWEFLFIVGNPKDQFSHIETYTCQHIPKHPDINKHLERVHDTTSHISNISIKPYDFIKIPRKWGVDDHDINNTENETGDKTIKVVERDKYPLGKNCYDTNRYDNNQSVKLMSGSDKLDSPD